MKAKLIWSAVGSVLLLLGGLAGYASLTTAHYPPVPAATQPVAAVVVNTRPEVSAVAALVNQERVTAGLPALADNAMLDSAAATKCADMAARNYWSHNDPEGRTPWHFITDQGYSYRYAGENLAYGFTDSASTVTGWMNSPGHRANILRADFTEVGTAVCFAAKYQGTINRYIVVQEFGTPL